MCGRFEIHSTLEIIAKIFNTDGAEIGNFLTYPVEMDYGVKVSIGRTGR